MHYEDIIDLEYKKLFAEWQIRILRIYLQTESMYPGLLV